MVTLRRDVAASNSNKIFDRQDRDRETLTNYDKFVQAKNLSSQKNFSKYSDDYVPLQEKSYSNSASNDCYFTDAAGADNSYFGNPNFEYKDTNSAVSCDEYGEYLKSQINRDKPSVLLSKEEYYASRFASEKNAEDNKKTKKKGIREKFYNKKITRNGKIFIACYVLTVAVVASIILAVNVINEPKKVNAGGVSDNDKQQISSMVVENNPVEKTNWFDKLLDGLSNE